MWKLLKRTHIEQARQELALRRAATLKRQAEEIEDLNADHAAVETLERLAAAFAEKFAKPPPLAAPSPAPSRPRQWSRKRPAPRKTQPATSRRRKFRAVDKRDYSGTNFGVFSWAAAKSTF